MEQMDMMEDEEGQGAGAGAVEEGRGGGGGGGGGMRRKQRGWYGCCSDKMWQRIKPLRWLLIVLVFALLLLIIARTLPPSLSPYSSLSLSLTSLSLSLFHL